jgi:hypothetical protein
MQTALLTKASSSTLPVFTLEAPQFRKSGDIAAPAVGAVHSYAKDEEIFAEGDRAAYVYKVLSGVVRSTPSTWVATSSASRPAMNIASAPRPLATASSSPTGVGISVL